MMLELRKLRGVMAENQLHEEDVARVLGRHRSVVSRILTGRRRVRASERALLAGFLGVPGEILFPTHRRARRKKAQ